MKNNYSILYISYDFPPRIGGQSTLNFNLFSLLRKKYKVTLVTNEKNKDIIDFSLLNRAKSSIWNIFYLFPKIGKKYDLIIAGDSNFSGFVAGLYGLFINKPVINLCHGTDFISWLKDRGLRGFLNRKLFQRNVVTIANSEYTKELVLKNKIAKKVIAINPGVDLSCYRIIKKKDNYLTDCFSNKNKTILLTVSRLIKRKGIDLVLKALSEIKSNFLYLIIGIGEELDNLKVLTAKLNLDRKVVFLGKVTDDEKVYYYNFCDIFILTPFLIEGAKNTDYEGFGMVYLEANACGKPVVAANSGGVSCAVKDDYSGTVVDPENVAQIKDAILTYINNKEYYKEISENSRLWAENFSWHKLEGQYIETIDSVLNK